MEASSRERQRHSAGNKGQRGLTRSMIRRRRRARAGDAWAGQAHEARGGCDLDTKRSGSLFVRRAVPALQRPACRVTMRRRRAGRDTSRLDRLRFQKLQSWAKLPSKAHRCPLPGRFSPSELAALARALFDQSSARELARCLRLPRSAPVYCTIRKLARAKSVTVLTPRPPTVGRHQDC